MQEGPEDRIGAPRSSPAELRRATIGAAVGSIVEWFDVAVYAYLAVVIGDVFFSSDDQTVSLLSSFAVFGVAFVVRPLGGMFFGSLGDRIGRKRTLASVIGLVSVATVAIGLLPGYDTIGVLAPFLLVICRLLQGFSAGGEMGGASVFVAEHAPPQRRGFLVSLVETGAILGFLLGSIVVLVLNLTLTDAQLENWGWRIPFLLAAPLGLVSLWIRLRLEETPEFVELQKKNEIAEQPLRETVINYWPGILRTAGYSLFQNATLYVLLSYVPTFLSQRVGLDTKTASWAAVTTMAITCAVIPLAGAVSDRVGRRPVLATSCIASFLFGIPLFALMATGSAVAAFVGYALFGVILAIFLGATLATMNEQFSARVRYGGFSIGYNLSVSLFGGTAPFLMALLVNATDLNISPAFYVMAAAAITLVVLAYAPETAPAKQAR